MDEGRWITVEKDDAGEEDEKVLFRTFVNATIGSKKHRIKSKWAPYMLLLYTKKGESEIQGTMSSQSGSCGLNLSCKLSLSTPPSSVCKRLVFLLCFEKAKFI